MKLELNDKEAEFLLAILAQHQIVLYMQGKDNSEIDKLIHIVIDMLKQADKMEIFHSIYKEMKE